MERFDTVDQLLEHYGLDRKDTKKHFVTGGFELYFPYIGEDGRAHLGKQRFLKEK